MIAISASAAGMDADAAWAYALRTLPECGVLWFTGEDPDAEWCAALEAVNSISEEEADDADAWDEWVDDLCDDPVSSFQETGAGYWSESDTATTLCTGPGATMRNLVGVGSGRRFLFVREPAERDRAKARSASGWMKSAPLSHAGLVQDRFRTACGEDYEARCPSTIPARAHREQSSPSGSPPSPLPGPRRHPFRWHPASHARRT
jgi:hypothetical protein